MIKRCYFLTIFIFILLDLDAAIFLTPAYEQMLRPEMREDYCWQASLFAEHGFSTMSLNGDGESVNTLRIWNSDQDALAMLNGFSPCSPIGQLRTQIGANDDGIRGHYLVCGDLDYKWGVNFAARKGLPWGFCIDLFLPVYSLELKNVQWINQTLDITADDARTRQYLTNNFFGNVAQLGCLDLRGWNRAGIGDLTLMAEWLQDFKQTKDFLDSVRILARAAVIFPTSKQTDEDLLFAQSLGFDGAAGLLVGGGLSVTIAHYVRAGFDVELTHLFSTTRSRRIKTDIAQTELLLLEKIKVLKDYGLTQRFNLFVELFHILGGLSAKVGYQFYRHNDDLLSVYSNAASSVIANTSRSLEEWTLHNLFAIVSYDGDHDSCSRFHPYVSAYVKIPFNGQFITSFKTVGIVLSVDF